MMMYDVVGWNVLVVIVSLVALVASLAWLINEALKP